MGLFDTSYLPPETQPGFNPALSGGIPPMAQPLQANPLMGLQAHAAPMPSAPTPPPGRFQRFLNMVMPQSGLASLMSPDQQKAAQRRGLMQFSLNMLANSRGQYGSNAPSFGQALASSVNAGQGAYQNDVQQTVGGEMTANDIMQKQAMQEKRAQIAAMFPPSPNETPQQAALRALHMFNAFSQAGDEVMAGKLGEMLKSMGDVLKGPTPTALHTVNLGDRTIEVDAQGNIVKTYKNGESPASAEAKVARDNAASMRTDALNSRNEGRLVTQYQSVSRKYSQTADAIQAINENRSGALAGDPVAQQTLLQDFIKLNLPGQMVTEGELGHYAGLMGLGDKAGQLLEKLKQGSPLSTTQIKLILQHADNLMVERKKGLKYIRDQYVQRGARQGVPEDSFVDWFGFLPQTTEGEKMAVPTSGSSSRVQAALGKRP